MGYVEENLLPNEKVLYSARIHPGIFLPSIVIFIIALGMALFGISLGSRYGGASPSSYLLYMALILAILAAISALEALVIRRTTEFAVTNRRVIAKSGLIRTHALEMLLSKVESVDMNQSLTGRLLGYGTITLTGTGGTKERIAAISNPLGVRRYLDQILEQVSQGSTNEEKPEPPAVG